MNYTQAFVHFVGTWLQALGVRALHTSSPLSLATRSSSFAPSLQVCGHYLPPTSRTLLVLVDGSTKLTTHGSLRNVLLLLISFELFTCGAPSSRLDAEPSQSGTCCYSWGQRRTHMLRSSVQAARA